MGSTASRPRTRTYAASGVDLSGRSRALRALLGSIRSRAPSSHGRPISAPGHYAGLLRVGRETIAITTDTVGTKVLLAEQLGRWEEVGEDLVAINVNDLAAVGARAAGLVDTILCARPDAARFRAIGRGVDRGLVAARCSLLGGETAVVPEIVRDLDLGGTAIGFFPAGRRPVLGNRIRPGDALVGIPSSGPHANGYTLLRRILDEQGVDLDRPRPGGRLPVGVELLCPTRTYTDAADAIADLPAVHGLAHISGGGVRNLPRLHPRRRYVLDAWPEAPPLFSWIQRTGGITDRESFQTFNMGIGFVAVVAREGVPAVLRQLSRHGARDAAEIGSVETGSGVEIPGRDVRFEGYA